ncbi:lytic murein transglycosylase [Rugosimonospora acidiphila]|uniref:Lytic murein transglycosylase n=1 Tax=Rugosimonospora acidiphila TaxID=556531 RepID=A0ABP9RIR6_9ACTN
MTGTDQASPPALRPATPPDPARHRRPRLSWVFVVGRHIGRAAIATGRATQRWALRPSGRFALPALALAALLAVAGSAGGYLVPATAPNQPLPVPSGGAQDTDPAQAGGPQLGVPTEPDPTDTSLPGMTDVPTEGPTAPAQPQDALVGWAGPLSTTLSIPIVALQAYGYAQLSEQQSEPACHLTWTTLAGIGKVESNHGRANGAELLSSGKAVPPIIGLPLDGNGNRAKITDTDHGQYDGDSVYDRAVGPMQFVPSTWNRYQVDADQDGTADPNDINDAALAAANYLCAGGRDLSKPGDWWAAILSYNALQSYAENVFTAANDYGIHSRGVI